ncbi:hypothetical protein ABZW30_42330 [Kitasatospora sp. NPDC004669]|uniref:hypothetical protein n=1 Tax=Kitasatospora sp. NPDC004669 TaxID=3154555 RepID=UPI0033A9E55A
MTIFPSRYRVAHVAAVLMVTTAGVVSLTAPASATALASTVQTTPVAVGMRAPTLSCISDAQLGIPNGTYLYCNNGVTYDMRTGQAVPSTGYLPPDLYHNILNSIGP